MDKNIKTKRASIVTGHGIESWWMIIIKKDVAKTDWRLDFIAGRSFPARIIAK